MFVTVVFLTTLFAVGDAYAKDFTCDLNLVEREACSHTIKTGEKITATLDGQEQSVAVVAKDKSSDYGATLQVSVDDEKQPDISIRPDGTDLKNYDLPRARKLVVENDSQNSGVPVLVEIKENDAEDTYKLDIFSE